MFRSDIISLREFYSSPLGSATSRLMRNAVRDYWPELGKDTMIGIGYTLPLLPIWKQSKREEAHISSGCFSFMPANLGAIYWPARGKNKSAMVGEDALPIRDGQCNRILMLHGLEHSEAASSLLDECWRALVPGGRILICVPHRISAWSRRENSPFATGHPYSLSELKQLLAEHDFTFKRASSVLHTPPIARSWFIKLMPWAERLLATLFPLFGGVLMVEVEKQLYASVTQKSPTLSRVGALMPKPRSVAQNINRN